MSIFSLSSSDKRSAFRESLDVRVKPEHDKEKRPSMTGKNKSTGMMEREKPGNTILVKKAIAKSILAFIIISADGDG